MKLDDIVPWGRSFVEYRHMFDLDNEDLTRTILGCGDGPASFNAEMTEMGYRVVSVDPLYAFPCADIRARIESTYDVVLEQTRSSADRYLWNEFSGVEALGRARLAAMERFLRDYNDGIAANRYLAASLPNLPFAGNTFDLALCSHLLFLYSERLSLEFHISSLREMLRVAGEVRVFPLLDLAGAPSGQINAARRALEAFDFHVDVSVVPYEFQRGGDKMMRIRRA